MYFITAAELPVIRSFGGVDAVLFRFLIMTVVNRGQVHSVMVTMVNCHPVNSAGVRLFLMEDGGLIRSFPYS